MEDLLHLDQNIKSKHFSKKTLTYFQFISKYYIKIKENDPLKNIDILYDSIKENTIDIKRNGKKETIECEMVAKYDKKTETFRWRDGANEHFRKLFYKEYGEHTEKYGSREIIEIIFTDEYKIEEKYHYLMPYFIVLFFPEYTILELNGEDLVYYGLIKLGSEYSFTVGDVLIDFGYIVRELYYYIEKQSRTNNSKKSSKKRDSKKSSKKNKKPSKKNLIKVRS